MTIAHDYYGYDQDYEDADEEDEPQVAPGVCPFCDGAAHAKACATLRAHLLDDAINVAALIESLDDARDALELLTT